MWDCDMWCCDLSDCDLWDCEMWDCDLKVITDVRLWIKEESHLSVGQEVSWEIVVESDLDLDRDPFRTELESQTLTFTYHLNEDLSWCVDPKAWVEQAVVQQLLQKKVADGGKRSFTKCSTAVLRNTLCMLSSYTRCSLMSAAQPRYWQLCC